MLTHINLTSAVACCKKDTAFSPTDVHISYLPMAHIYEMLICMVGLAGGGSAGFWRGDILGLLEDIQELKPTIFVGVPRVFNRIYDKVLAGVGDAGKFKQLLFNYALSSKRAALEAGATSSVWDKIVFKKIQDLMGGRVRLIVSGSAPLGAEVHHFLRTVTGAVVKQGYGLTETSALLCVQLDCDLNSAGHVGPPAPANEVKLVDVPEMGYFSANTPQRGEIAVRGNNVFMGYYKAQDKTDEVLTKDGWFHTGDIGEWQPNGTLKIIDRKKNIFKLAQGEYVAVEMIETILTRAKYVMQIFVHGDSLKDYLVAVVVPDAETVLPWAKANGLPTDMATLSQHPRLKKLLYDDIVATGAAGKLAGFQLPRNIHIEPVPWSVENALLTPSMKIKRPSVKSHYQAVIDKLYTEPRLDGTPPAKL
jgi:long-chain acyl-CoA synthetase